MWAWRWLESRTYCWQPWGGGHSWYFLISWKLKMLFHMQPLIAFMASVIVSVSWAFRGRNIIYIKSERLLKGTPEPLKRHLPPSLLRRPEVATCTDAVTLPDTTPNKRQEDQPGVANLQDMIGLHKTMTTGRHATWQIFYGAGLPRTGPGWMLATKTRITSRARKLIQQVAATAAAREKCQTMSRVA